MVNVTQARQRRFGLVRRRRLEALVRTLRVSDVSAIGAVAGCRRTWPVPRRVGGDGCVVEVVVAPHHDDPAAGAQRTEQRGVVGVTAYQWSATRLGWRAPTKMAMTAPTPPGRRIRQ
jgi:hypothetical protein